MKIALDYDDTFSRDPDAWLAVAKVLRAAGHDIIGVSMRTQPELQSVDKRYYEACHRVIGTSREAKRTFLLKKNILIDVWIDDSPGWIERDAGDRVMPGQMHSNILLKTKL